MNNFFPDTAPRLALTVDAPALRELPLWLTSVTFVHTNLRMRSLGKPFNSSHSGREQPLLVWHAYWIRLLHCHLHESIDDYRLEKLSILLSHRFSTGTEQYSIQVLKLAAAAPKDTDSRIRLRLRANASSYPAPSASPLAKVSVDYDCINDDTSVQCRLRAIVRPV